MADERQDIARRLRELRAWRGTSLKVIAVGARGNRARAIGDRLGTPGE
ncbi:MAG: hypothetical protein ACRDQ4_27755 [Pseudonocardiaceae bacterium]